MELISKLPVFDMERPVGCESVKSEVDGPLVLSIFTVLPATLFEKLFEVVNPLVPGVMPELVTLVSVAFVVFVVADREDSAKPGDSAFDESNVDGPGFVDLSSIPVNCRGK